MTNSKIIVVTLVFVFGATFLLINKLNKDKEFYAEQTIKCRDAGQQELKETQESRPTFIADPQYTYSKSLGTCIYKGSYDVDGGSYFYIKDLYRGSYIAEWGRNSAGETAWGNKEKYEQAIKDFGF